MRYRAQAVRCAVSERFGLHHQHLGVANDFVGITILL
jgi:hypothetical protein